MGSRTKNSFRNISFGMINKLASIIFPFITRTVIIYIMGKEYLGLNSLFTSILQVLSLSELGIGSALVFSMYKPIAEKDKQKVSALLNLYRKCYKVIGFIVLIIGLSILPFIRLLVHGELPSEINIYVVYSIYLFNSVITYFFFAYRQSVIIASQRNDIISKINLVTIIFQNIIQISLLLIFKNYYLYLVVLPIFSIIYNLLIYIISKNKFHEYVPKGKVEKVDLLEIKKNIKGLVFHKVGSIVLNSVDNIVISAFLGIAIVGVYNNYYFIISALFGILLVVQDSLKASVGNSIVKESVEKNYSDFIKFNFLYMWIVSWCTVCFLCLVQHFIHLWVGDSYLLDNKIAFIFAIYFFIYKWFDMLYIYQEAKGLWWKNRYVQLIGAVTNLIINIILVKIIGLYGILLSTIFSILFVLDVGYFLVLFKEYFNRYNWKKQYIINQLYYLSVTLIVGVICYFLCNCLENSLFMFIIKGIILIILPNLLFLLFYNKKKEFIAARQFILDCFTKKLSKRG